MAETKTKKPKAKTYATERNYTSFGAFMQAKRLEQDISQRALAEAMGYSSPQFISNFERGLALPPIKKTPILVKLLKLDREEVIKKYQLIYTRELRELLRVR